MPAFFACPSVDCRCRLSVDSLSPSLPVLCPLCGEKMALLSAAEADRATLTLDRGDHETPTRSLPSDDPGRATLSLIRDEPAESTRSLPASAAAEAPAPGPDLPATIGRFQVEARLGEGAFGVVYRAYDPQLDRPVALKVAKPGSLDTPAKRERFLREAKAAANLRHPNIVPLYETGAYGSQLYICSALIEGRTLEELIADTEGRE